MAVRERRLPRTQQPQDGAQLDLSNALTRGLLWSYDYAGRSLGGVAHAVTYRSGYGRRVGSQGIAAEPNVANAGFTFTVPDTTLDEFTLVIVADLPSRAAPSSSAPLVGIDTLIGIGLYQYGGGLDLLSRAYYAPDYSGAISSDMTGAVPASGRCVIVQTYRRNSHLRNYVNGQYINGATPGNYPARWGGGTLGNTIYVNGSPAQTIGVQATWLQAASLDDEEARRVSDNPWQLFEPRRIWVPVSAGGGVTGTFSRTAGNDTAIFNGTTTVLGSLSKTTLNDTGLISGTTTVVGSFTNTGGTDTITASGSVGSPVSGTFSVTGGSDSIAASGTTTVVGSLSLSTTSDTLLASGTTTIVGTMAVTVANDTLISSGTTTIVGTVNISANGDTLSASGSIGSAVSGTFTVSGQLDTLSATGTTTLLGTFTVSATGDTLNATGNTTVLGSLTVTLNNDFLSAGAAVGPVADVSSWMTLTNVGR